VRFEYACIRTCREGSPGGSGRRRGAARAGYICICLHYMTCSQWRCLDRGLHPLAMECRRELLGALAVYRKFILGMHVSCRGGLACLPGAARGHCHSTKFGANSDCSEHRGLPFVIGLMTSAQHCNPALVTIVTQHLPSHCAHSLPRCPS
jgi:hypothetical protein